MSTDIDKLLQKTKGQLFFNKSCSAMLGRIMSTLSFQWTTDFQTAAISDTTLYWNPDFFLSLDQDSRVTVLAHELYHNARLHSIRMGDRCPDIWNQAGDHVINLDLETYGFYMGGFPYLMDPKYRGWSTEDVYDDLITNGGKPLTQPQLSMIGDIVPFSGNETAKVAAIGTVISSYAAAKMSNQAGSIPGDGQLFIDEFLDPVLPWETLIFNWCNQLAQPEYSYARPHRRYDDPIMRSLVPDYNGLDHLVYAIDVSGSTTDEDVHQVTSEIKHVWDEFQPEKMTIIAFDTKVRSTWVYNKDDNFEPLEIVGRGGTDLVDVYNFIIKEAPTAAIIFTDLWVDIPPNPGIPILWAIMSNPGVEAPYGTTVHIPPYDPKKAKKAA